MQYCLEYLGFTLVCPIASLKLVLLTDICWRGGIGTLGGVSVGLADIGTTGDEFELLGTKAGGSVDMMTFDSLGL